MARIIDKKLCLDGYVYLRSRRAKGKTYWDCRRVRSGECNARAITNDPLPEEELTVLRGPAESQHSHPPNREECAAETVTQTLKRKAREHPELPPAHLLRTELQTVPTGVLSQLPEQEALKKAMRRERRKNLPPNPKKLSDLGELPDQYQRTLQGERFLIWDSGHDDESDEDDYEEEEEQQEQVGANRVLVFSTRRNLELLCQSSTWFVDGTFKVTPDLFTQVFTVLGLRRRNVVAGEGVPLPFAYALLSSKRTNQYTAALRAVKNAVDAYRINECNPTRIISDFELAIINAAQAVFPDVPVQCCLFHLGQSLYRKIQAEGLQQAYNNPEDRSIKQYTHMILALAYVPLEDVRTACDLLRDDVPDELLEIMDYFKVTYVVGRPARGRRAAVAPRYPPPLWNVYNATVNDTAKTNNASEGWHNRFRLLLGKHHPDMYTFLKEIQKEQADTEVSIAELSLGKKVKAAPKKKWLELQARVRSVALRYDDEFKRENRLLDYLRTIGYNVNL